MRRSKVIGSSELRIMYPIMKRKNLEPKDEVPKSQGDNCVFEWGKNMEFPYHIFRLNHKKLRVFSRMLTTMDSSQ